MKHDNCSRCGSYAETMELKDSVYVEPNKSKKDTIKSYAKKVEKAQRAIKCSKNCVGVRFCSVCTFAERVIPL